MFERGDLLLVPFPFSDLSAAKRRPVLALTAPDSYGDFIALPVTSRPQAEHGIPLTSSDLVRGALPAPSWIRTDRPVELVLRQQPGILDEPSVALRFEGGAAQFEAGRCKTHQGAPRGLSVARMEGSEMRSRAERLAPDFASLIRATLAISMCGQSWSANGSAARSGRADRR
jgi:hypothetical protein